MQVALVDSTNVTNVTTLGVVISPRRVSQHQSQHQQQTSSNYKRQTSKCHKINASSYFNALQTTDAGTSIPCRLVYCL